MGGGGKGNQEGMQSSWIVVEQQENNSRMRGEVKLKTNYVFGNLLGTPDTSRRGRNTRNARRALTSKPPDDLPPEVACPSTFSTLVVTCSKTTLNKLYSNKTN